MKKILTFLIATVILLGSFQVFPSASAAPPPFSIEYEDVYLNVTDGTNSSSFSDVWNLTEYDMEISFIYNATGLNDDLGEPGRGWVEFGLKEADEPANFMFTWRDEGIGIWLLGYTDTVVDTFDPDPFLDVDDILILNKAGGKKEENYDLPAAPPNPFENHRLYFDRDGVSASQAQNPTYVDGGTYNTSGIYEIVIRLHANTDTSGTAFMTVNALDQGFEVDQDWDTMELTPAGMSFTANMSDMRIFYGLLGQTLNHYVSFHNITVSALKRAPRIEWIRAWGTPEGRLDPGGEVVQGHVVRLYTRVSDAESGPGDLDVEISYSLKGEDSWTTQTATYLGAKDYFYYDLDTWTVDPGMYNVKVDVVDTIDGNSTTCSDNDEFDVKAPYNIDWIRVWGTPEGRLDPGGDVEQGHVVRMYTRVSNGGDTPIQDLDVDISYRLQEGGWTANNATYLGAKNYFYYDLDTSGVEVGMYDVKVDVDDPFNPWSESDTETGEFNVFIPPVVEWVKAWGTPEGRLDPGGEVEKGHSVRLYARVSDDETPTQDLDVEISYRLQGGGWTTQTATYLGAKNYFYYDLDTSGVELGMYDVKVDVDDTVGGGSATDTDSGEFNVTSAPPVVEWVKAWGTPEGRLDPGGDVEQGHSVRLYARVSDDETPVQDLNVDISYRRQGGSWTRETATYLGAKNYFYYDLDTSSLQLGMYDVKADVDDLVAGGSATGLDIGEFNIT